MLRLIASTRSSLRRLPTTLTWGLQLQRTFATATKPTSTSSTSNEGKKFTRGRKKKPITPEDEAKRQQKIAKRAQLKADLKEARAEKKLRAEINRSEKSTKLQEKRAALRERKLRTIAKARERRENIRLKKAMEPRKPGNAFTFYAKHRFAELFPLTKNLGETSRRLSAEWKTLPAQQKKPFEDAYAAAREKFVAAVAEKPKRPMTSFLNFVKQERSKIPKVNGVAGSQQLLKELSQRWKKLTQEEKARYGPSPADMAEYSRAIEAYKTKIIQLTQQQIQQQKQKRQQQHQRQKQQQQQQH